VNHNPWRAATPVGAAKRRCGDAGHAGYHRNRNSALFDWELRASSARLSALSLVILRDKSRFIVLRNQLVTAKLAVLGFAAATLISFATAPVMGQEQAPAPQAKQFGPRAGKPAVQGKQQSPPAETIAKHGAWEVQCADAPPGQDGAVAGQKSCGMIQTVKSESNQNVGISVIVSKLKRGDKSTVLMRVMAPIGVYLPTGIPVEIDGAALPNRLTFTRCLPRVCEGFGEASPESLTKFMKGGTATFFLYDRPGNGYPLKVSLQGFAKALSELDKL
jgi:invasion protein IalB